MMAEHRSRNVMLRFSEPELTRVMAAWEQSQKAKTAWERTPFAPWLRQVILNLFPVKVAPPKDGETPEAWAARIRKAKPLVKSRKLRRVK